MPFGVETRLTTEKIVANNPEKATENIRKKALQWGDTVFNPTELELLFAQPYLIPASTLGEMKRDLVQKLCDFLIEKHLSGRAEKPIQPTDCPYPETELSYLGNVTNAKAAEFYRQHGVTEVEDALEKSFSKQAGLKVMTTKHCVRYANGLCSKETGQKATPLFLQNGNNTFRLEFDCRNCQMNIFTMEK